MAAAAHPVLQLDARGAARRQGGPPCPVRSFLQSGKLSVICWLTSFSLLHLQNKVAAAIVGHVHQCEHDITHQLARLVAALLASPLVRHNLVCWLATPAPASSRRTHACGCLDACAVRRRRARRPALPDPPRRFPQAHRNQRPQQACLLSTLNIPCGLSQ